MNIKVNDYTLFKKELVILKPCLITDSKRVFLANPKTETATLIAYLDKDRANLCSDLIGHAYDYSDWCMSDYELFKGSITLSND